MAYILAVSKHVIVHLIGGKDIVNTSVIFKIHLTDIRKVEDKILGKHFNLPGHGIV